MRNAWFAAPLLAGILGCPSKPVPPAPTPTPTVAPTPAPTPDPCPSPKPGRVAKWKTQRIGNWADFTPIVKGHLYCVEIGLPTLPDGVTPRYECPVRAEGSPEREACEREATGDIAWACPLGGTLVVNPANRLQAKCIQGSHVQACDSTGAVCAGVIQ